MLGSIGDDRTPVQSFRERRPVAALAPYVSSVWMQQVAPSSSSYLHRTVPNGSAELVCEVGSLPRVVGPQTGSQVQRLAAGTAVVGVRLRPGAIPVVIGVPAFDLVDATVGFDELWGGWADELGGTLAAAQALEFAAAALEQVVVTRVVAAASAPDAVAAEVMRRLHPARGAVDVGSLASLLHVSERQLRRRCQMAIGFAPKALQRMLRFQRFLALAEDPRFDGGLARLAGEAGYADQAHLTRESRRLAAQSPRRLLWETAKHCGALHDHAVSHERLLGPTTTADPAPGRMADLFK